MKIIPADRFPRRNLAELRDFLGECRQAARADGHFKIASISLGVWHIDPLAVLQSVYEPAEMHFYLENPAQEEAVAGADDVVSGVFAGKDRFFDARNFISGVLDHTIACGDLDLPMAGPHFFCAFTFGAEVERGASFHPATLFLPRWQVARRGRKFVAVANVRVDPTSEIEPLGARVWAAYSRFAAFEYGRAPHLPPSPARGGVTTEELLPGRFEETVRKALGLIEQKKIEKIVLSRSLELRGQEAFAPLDALDRLRRKFPGCYLYSFANGREQTYIGASPERLLRLQARRFDAEAVGGSAPRGADACEDARLAVQLLHGEKELREQNYITDFIRQRLASFSIVPEVDPPQLHVLSNVQHLRSAIRAVVRRDGIHLFDLAEKLHPTPAVGGMPRERALPLIRELEGYDRGLYAGLAGFVDARGEGELVVAIRSALIEGRRARLYAGAGIVRGSDPASEKRETDTKLRALLDELT